jgi:hypothetical protein
MKTQIKKILTIPISSNKNLLHMMAGIDRYKCHSVDHYRQHSEGVCCHNWKEETKNLKFAWLLTNDDEVTIRILLTIPISSNKNLLHMMVGIDCDKCYSPDCQHSEVLNRHSW